jgi:hypothetical protein
MRPRSRTPIATRSAHAATATTRSRTRRRDPSRLIDRELLARTARFRTISLDAIFHAGNSLGT